MNRRGGGVGVCGLGGAMVEEVIFENFLTIMVEKHGSSKLCGFSLLTNVV